MTPHGRPDQKANLTMPIAVVAENERIRRPRRVADLEVR